MGSVRKGEGRKDGGPRASVEGFLRTGWAGWQQVSADEAGNGHLWRLVTR